MAHDDELHIAGVVVHAVPQRCIEVAGAVALLPGTEVHAASPAGKLVVTVEAPGSDEVGETIRRIQSIPGVLGAALVYQCGDTLAAMNEEMRDASA